ncbi:MAG: hypothetical protein PHH98_05560 [Candidatus Gracilibacteria bacterium]|nr:hypothetical protein [Candidatus Gracilibacteria bacterium]
MKITQKIILILISIFSIFMINNTYATNIEGLDNINNEKSIAISGASSDISDTINTVTLDILSKIKFVFSGILLIYMVYAGAQMIMSMGTDDDSLSSAKKSLWYAAIGLFFINMPGTIYNAVKGDKTTVNGGIGNSWSNEISSTTTNLFINTDVFAITLNNTVVKFLEIILVGIAIMVIIIAGLKIITSRGREEQITEAKHKILWSIIGLIFIGFIEAWQKFAYAGKIADGTNIFKTIANLALFLAGPIAIFFLTLAGYYYITSAGDEEKAKKGKSIVINTVLGTAILLVSYVFLYDLLNF